MYKHDSFFLKGFFREFDIGISKMNIFGENGFFLNKTSFQDLLFSKARVTRFTASLVELSPFWQGRLLC